MTPFPETPSFEHLFDAHIQLAPPEDHGQTPYGRRSVHLVTSGAFEGARLRGTVRAGGGDWLLSYDDGYNELDVRATLETDDGALIYLHYHGVLHVAPEVMARAVRGDDISPSEYYFRTTPRFETGDKRYAWLNTLVCVAYGAFGPQRVSYRVFGVK
jgi:hypothetical protein